MTFATISTWMRLNLFSRRHAPEPTAQPLEHVEVRTGRTFPADEVVWGIAIRHGFDEIDDPWYHRGITQHAYLEGHDHVALCGFRPALSGPRTRRRSRLGLPTDGEHPMCGICARMVVAPRPRPRVPVPIQAPRPTVAVPVSRDPRLAVPRPAMVGAANGRGAMSPGAPASPGQGFPVPGAGPAAGGATVPQVRYAGSGPEVRPSGLPAAHESGGLMARGVHAERTD